MSRDDYMLYYGKIKLEVITLKKVNVVKVLGYVGTALSIGAQIINSINQKNEIAEAAKKAVEELQKNN